MTFESDSFLNTLPLEWKGIYSVLRNHGFSPTIVGGAVRDFLLFGSASVDFDIELRHPILPFDQTSWKSLGKALSDFGKVTYLPFEIIRLEILHFEFEFSPPRREVFFKDWQNHGHSNFVAQFDFQMKYEESVLRRDFTINSIGVSFKELDHLEINDPLSGIDHLNLKILKPCGPDFHKDSVRFLRAFRFRTKLNFAFSKELEANLLEMSLTKIGPTFFWDELQKSNNPFHMFSSLLSWQEMKQDLCLPVDTMSLKGKLNDFESALIDSHEHDYWIIAFEWVEVDSSQWQDFFKLSLSHYKSLKRWTQLTKKMQIHLPEKFHGEFDQIKDLSDFDTLFDWYFTTKQMMQKKSSRDIIHFIEKFLPDWSLIFRFDLPTDVKHIEPPLRSKYQVWNLCQRL